MLYSYRYYRIHFLFKKIYLIQIHQNWWNYIDYLSLVFFPHDSARQSNVRFEL